MDTPSSMKVKTDHNDLTLGWIGLGSMGLAMALNIQKHLQTNNSPGLRYWNRTQSRGKPMAELGGSLCETPGLVARESDVIFISVSDDTALRSVISSLSTVDLTGKIIVDTTTIHPTTTSWATTHMLQNGATYIAAPVFGSTPVAQAGRLLVAIAGSPQAISAVEPYLKGVIARGVIHVGDEPSQAMILKTTSNMLTAGLTYLISEAHTLAEKSGLPSEILEDLIEQNFGSYAHGVSKRLTTGAYMPPEGVRPQSSLELGIKDVQLGIELAESKGMKLDVAERWVEAAREARGWGVERRRSLDSSSVFGVVRGRAGLGFETAVVKRRDVGMRGEDR